MKAFIEGMPKAELHVHLEGTLEPEHIFKLATRNHIELAYKTPEEVVAAYDFHDLPSFLTIYYAAMDVLREEEDFYELTYQYFERAAADNVVYVEPFFDPQAHTARGVAFDTVINGIRRAQEDAAKNLGIRSNLIAAGPLNTRAAGGIPDFDKLLDNWEMRSPIKWDPDDAEPVADVVGFLLSDLSRAITGEIVHVDGGYHAMAGALRFPD